MQLRIPEQINYEHRLGRHINHDPRSLAYQVKSAASLAVSKQWNPTVQLDQGTIGSCTGNATVGALSCDPYYSTLHGKVLDEALAVKIYSIATQIDGFPGTYPPQDTGSDGLSAAKAAQQLGLISGYLHATSLDATITALQTGPAITGVSWYEGFDHPDSTGMVSISGAVRGGHEFALIGVDMENKVLHALNSWGSSWGDNGRFYFSFADFTRLLNEKGDVTSFVPVTDPAPTPVVGDLDKALWTQLQGWATAKHIGSNKRAADAVVSWAKNKNL